MLEATDKKRSKRVYVLWSIALVMLLTVWLIGFGGYPLFFWSPLNCRHEDVDIRTGQIRRTHILAGLRVSEKTEDSPLTRALAEEDTRSANPEWHRVNTFSPGVRHSPHYRYHSAIFQMQLLEKTWKFYGLDSAAKRETALAVLELWQETGGDHAAGQFITHLQSALGQTGGKLRKSAVREAAAAARGKPQ